MTKNELIEMLQEDLKNEKKHMMYYLHASVMVRGLHREEIGEIFLQEAKSELEHCEQFSRMIVQLGGTPGTEVADFEKPGPFVETDPLVLLTVAKLMEEEVANNYAKRLNQTEQMDNAHTAVVHLFYEDQIVDSYKAAREFHLMASKF